MRSGGVVADSVPEAEYEESLNKARAACFYASSVRPMNRYLPSAAIGAETA